MTEQLTPDEQAKLDEICSKPLSYYRRRLKLHGISYLLGFLALSTMMFWGYSQGKVTVVRALFFCFAANVVFFTGYFVWSCTDLKLIKIILHLSSSPKED